MKYRKVLVPLDGSPLAEAALAQLPYVAGDDTEVILLRVAELTPDVVSMVFPTYPGIFMGPMAMPSASWEMTETVTEAVATGVREAEEYLAGIATTLIGRVGGTKQVMICDLDPAAVIASQAQAEGADLILMATHGRSSVVRWVLGSVADQVPHATTIPLLLVRPGQPTE